MTMMVIVFSWFVFKYGCISHLLIASIPQPPQNTFGLMSEEQGFKKVLLGHFWHYKEKH